MDKYRIRQIGYKYYPQVRFLFIFWCNFIEDNGNALSYDSLESAKNFLTVDHVQRKMKNKVEVHKFKLFEG